MYSAVVWCVCVCVCVCVHELISSVCERSQPLVTVIVGIYVHEYSKIYMHFVMFFYVCGTASPQPSHIVDTNISVLQKYLADSHHTPLCVLVRRTGQ